MKVWLHGVAGFLPVAAGAVPGLLSFGGGSLAGDGEPGDGRQLEVEHKFARATVAGMQLVPVQGVGGRGGEGREGGREKVWQ